MRSKHVFATRGLPLRMCDVSANALSLSGPVVATSWTGSGACGRIARVAGRLSCAAARRPAPGHAARWDAAMVSALRTLVLAAVLAATGRAQKWTEISIFNGCRLEPTVSNAVTMDCDYRGMSYSQVSQRLVQW